MIVGLSLFFFLSSIFLVPLLFFDLHQALLFKAAVVGVEGIDRRSATTMIGAKPIRGPFVQVGARAAFQSAARTQTRSSAGPESDSKCRLLFRA